MAVFNRLFDGAPTEGGGLIESLTTQSSLFIFAYCPRRRTLQYWSGNALQVLGVRDAEIATEGNLFLKHVHPDDRFALLNSLEQAWAGHGAYSATYRWLRPDKNELRWIHCRGSLSPDASEPLFDGFMVDITAAHEQFAHSPGSEFPPVMSAFPDLFCVLDLDLRIVRLHLPQGKEQCSFGDPGFQIAQFRVGCAFLDSFSDQEIRSQYQRILQDVAVGARKPFQTRVTTGERTYNLQFLPIEQGGAHSGVLIIAADNTELVRLERRLAELQRSEGLATLAAGVAHHFNNALQGILGQAAIVQHHPDQTELVRTAGQKITELVQRASELTRQLFAFDTSDRHAPTPTDPNVIVMAATNRIHDLLSSGIKVSVALGSPASVLLHQDNLVHAVEAVLRNACESMRDGGSLVVRTADSILRDLEIDDLPAGNYAIIRISDSGPGMSPEAARRCFEPFFTTKNRDPQSGLSLTNPGLGLSGALATVRRYGGSIRATTRPSAGTTITFYLPAERGAPATTSAPVPRKPEARILIVDDDEMVLNTMQALLQESGYPCAIFSEPTAALRVVEASPRQFLAALVDAVMPAMDGPTFIRRLTQVAPQIRAIGFSGANQSQLQRLSDAGAIAVLRKPVDPAQLREALDRALAPAEAA